jgi:hypothetical protein
MISVSIEPADICTTCLTQDQGQQWTPYASSKPSLAPERRVFAIDNYYLGRYHILLVSKPSRCGAVPTGGTRHRYRQGTIRTAGFPIRHIVVPAFLHPYLSHTAGASDRLRQTADPFVYLELVSLLSSPVACPINSKTSFSSFAYRLTPFLDLTSSFSTQKTQQSRLLPRTTRTCVT